MTSILPRKFDSSSDLATWLREFDACLLANDWKEEEKIKKLPAFLRGPAASLSTRYLQTTERPIKMQSKCSLVPCALQSNERIFTRSSKQERYDRGRIQLCINRTSNKSCLKRTHSSMVKPRKLSCCASS